MRRLRMKTVGSLLVATAMLVVGCSSGSKSSEPPQNEKQSISVIVSAGGSGRTFQAAAQHFTEKTGIEVKMVQYPYAEVREKQLLELGNKTGNLDVISVDGQIWLSELSGFLDPLSYESKDLEHLVPSMVNLFKFGKENKLYALPIRIGGWVLIYRKDLFDAQGLKPPKTWDEFLKAAQTFTKDGMYGFAPAMKQGNYLTIQWLPFLRSYGGKLLTQDLKKAAFNNDVGRKATQFFVDLHKTHKVTPPGAISYEHDGVVAAMQQGQAAMALTYSPNFLAMNDPKKSKVSGKLAVSTTIPYAEGSGLQKGITEVSGWGFGVASMSKNKKAAKQFIEFVASPEEQLRLALESENAPTAKSVYNDPKYMQAFPTANEVANALENAETRPGVEKWTAIEDVLAAELSAAINGVKTVEQALSDAEKQVNSLLK